MMAMETLLTIDECRSKMLETMFLIAICRQTGDKWQSKTMFLTIFDLCSLIVLKFLIAAYPMWNYRLIKEKAPI